MLREALFMIGGAFITFWVWKFLASFRAILPIR